MGNVRTHSIIKTDCLKVTFSETLLPNRAWEAAKSGSKAEGGQSVGPLIKRLHKLV